MDLVNRLLGNAGEISIEKLQKEFYPLLLESEQLE